MRKILKNALVTMLVTGLCLSFMGIVSAEGPSYDEISVSPVEPPRLSEVKFTVNIEGDNIQEVRIIVQECIEETCYINPQNKSMDYNTEDDTWETTVKLIHDDTTIGHCWLVIKSNGTWYDYSGDESTHTDFTVVEDSTDGNGGDGGDGADDTGGTPGFELILLVISLVVALSIYKRKRMR